MRTNNQHYRHTRRQATFLDMFCESYTEGGLLAWVHDTEQRYTHQPCGPDSAPDLRLDDGAYDFGRHYRFVFIEGKGYIPTPGLLAETGRSLRHLFQKYESALVFVMYHPQPRGESWRGFVNENHDVKLLRLMPSGKFERRYLHHSIDGKMATGLYDPDRLARGAEGPYYRAWRNDSRIRAIG